MSKCLGYCQFVEKRELELIPSDRQGEQSSWALQSYMGYSYEAFSTYPPTGEVVPDHEPEGWAGSVNQNVQVGPWASATPNSGLEA